MSESQELAIGQQADVEIQQVMGLYEDGDLQRYVEDIGLALADVSHRPALPWHFTVVDSPAINAFALPGGYIYLTRGILAYLQDESDLAGVLGHEIGHVTARHAVSAYTRASGAQLGLVFGQIFVPQMRNPYGPSLSDAAASGLGVLFLKFGRDAENQSDRLGAAYARSGGWDPRGVTDMLTVLGRIRELTDRRGTPNWMMTHPEPASRVAEVKPHVDSLLAGVEPAALRVNRAQYLDRIVGMRFGDNPEEGIVRGHAFLHPVLRFALTFPEGWEVQNSSAFVMAQQPGVDVYLVLQTVADPRWRDLEAIAEAEMRGAGYTLRSGGATTINGLEAYIGTYAVEARQEGAVLFRMAFIRHDNRVYAFGGVGPTATFQRVSRDITDSIRSFRPLSPAEAESIRPNELALYTVGHGDTWQAIAQDAGAGIVSAATLAIMNGFPVNEQPREGDVVKIVVAGAAPWSNAG